MWPIAGNPQRRLLSVTIQAEEEGSCACADVCTLHTAYSQDIYTHSLAHTWIARHGPQSCVNHVFARVCRIPLLLVDGVKDSQTNSGRVCGTSLLQEEVIVSGDGDIS